MLLKIENQVKGVTIDSKESGGNTEESESQGRDLDLEENQVEGVTIDSKELGGYKE